MFNRGVEVNPPLYYIFLHYWIQAFGDSEFSLRLPSVIFGSLSIIAIYALGKVLFGKKAGLTEALILSVSVFHIQYSQEASGDVVIVYPAHEQMSLDYYKTRSDLTVLAAPQKFPAFKNLGDNSIWVIMHAHPQNRQSIRQGLSAKYNFELAKSYIRLDLFRLKQK